MLDELRPVFLLVEPGAGRSRTLGGLPQVGTASAWGLDLDAAESDGTLLAVTQDPLTPPPRCCCWRPARLAHAC